MGDMSSQSDMLSTSATTAGSHPQPTAARPRSTARVPRGLGLVLAFVFALGAFFSGLQFGQGMQGSGQMASLFSLFAAEPRAVETAPDLEQFWSVWDILEEKYATGSSTSGLSEAERIEGAIQGLVNSYGDPYTVFLPPQEAETFAEDISGNFSGVGMEVGIRNGIVTVIAPLPDTPAEQAGIVAGDAIVSIDGTSTEDMRIDEAVKLIRGEQGTVVELEIYREGEADFLTIPITRDNIDIPTVQTDVVDDTFIIELYSFNAVAEARMREALVEYQRSGAETLVLDLRGNPGGYLQSAVAVASYFLPGGKVVVKEQFSDESKNKVFRSRGRQPLPVTPENFVVLVDNGSASASEIVAGALRDHGVATILGTQTFGKGSVQELVELDGGASLKVTVARWLTPDGTSISAGGLTPDIIISRTPQERIAGEDPQRDAALRFLAGEEVESESFADALSERVDTQALEGDEGTVED